MSQPIAGPSPPVTEASDMERLQYRYAQTASFKGWVVDGYHTPAGALVLLANADGDTREVMLAELLPSNPLLKETR